MSLTTSPCSAGIQHLIYGVTPEDLQIFVKAVIQSLLDSMGLNFITPTVGEMWKVFLTSYVKHLVIEADRLKRGVGGILFDKNRVDYYAYLTENTLLVYQDSKLQILKYFIILSEVPPVKLSQTKLDVVAQHSSPSLSILNYSFSVECPAPVGVVLFYTDSYEKLRSWQYEINLRICAHQKARKVKASIEEEALHNLLPEESKKLIIDCWEKLLSTSSINDDSESALTVLIRDFYKQFFKINPRAKPLFEKGKSTTQGRALIKILLWIIKSLNNPQDLGKTLRDLGNRHEIYGVIEHDYRIFSSVFVDTLKSVLGDQVCTPQVINAWKLLLRHVSSVMISAGRKMKQNPLETTVLYKRHLSSPWQPAYLQLTTDTISIYTNSTKTKLISSIPCTNIENIDVLPLEVMDQSPYHGLTLDIHSQRSFHFSFFSENILEEWTKELLIRTQAILRLFKEDEDTSAGDVSDLPPAMQAIQKMTQSLKRKKEQSDTTYRTNFSTSSSSCESPMVSKIGPKKHSGSFSPPTPPQKALSADLNRKHYSASTSGGAGGSPNSTHYPPKKLSSPRRLNKRDKSRENRRSITDGTDDDTSIANSSPPPRTPPIDRTVRRSTTISNNNASVSKSIEETSPRRIKQLKFQSKSPDLVRKSFKMESKGLKNKPLSNPRGGSPLPEAKSKLQTANKPPLAKTPHTIFSPPLERVKMPKKQPDQPSAPSTTPRLNNRHSRAKQRSDLTSSPVQSRLIPLTQTIQNVEGLKFSSSAPTSSVSGSDSDEEPSPPVPNLLRGRSYSLPSRSVQLKQH